MDRRPGCQVRGDQPGGIEVIRHRGADDIRDRRQVQGHTDERVEPDRLLRRHRHSGGRDTGQPAGSGRLRPRHHNDAVRRHLHADVTDAPRPFGFRHQVGNAVRYRPLPRRQPSEARHTDGRQLPGVASGQPELLQRHIKPAARQDREGVHREAHRPVAQEQVQDRVRQDQLDIFQRNPGQLREGVSARPAHRQRHQKEVQHAEGRRRRFRSRHGERKAGDRVRGR